MSMYDVAVHRVMIFWFLQELAVARDNDMITVIWSIKRDARTHPVRVLGKLLLPLSTVLVICAVRGA